MVEVCRIRLPLFVSPESGPNVSRLLTLVGYMLVFYNMIGNIRRFFNAQEKGDSTWLRYCIRMIVVDTYYHVS